jgi:hypothetical protein
MRAQGFEGGAGSPDGAQSRYVAAAAALSRVSGDEGERERRRVWCFRDVRAQHMSTLEQQHRGGEGSVVRIIARSHDECHGLQCAAATQLAVVAVGSSGAVLSVRYKHAAGHGVQRCEGGQNVLRCAALGELDGQQQRSIACSSATGCTVVSSADGYQKPQPRPVHERWGRRYEGKEGGQEGRDSCSNTRGVRCDATQYIEHDRGDWRSGGGSRQLGCVTWRNCLKQSSSAVMQQDAAPARRCGRSCCVSTARAECKRSGQNIVI